MVKTSGPKPVKSLIKHLTATRNLDTVYQNATGRPLLVIVTCIYVRSNQLGASALVTAQIEDVTPPVTTVCTVGLNLEDNNPDDVYLSLAVVVPPGYYYRMTTTTTAAGSSVTKSRWTEVEF